MNFFIINFTGDFIQFPVKLVDSLHSAISSHFVGRYRRNRSHSGSRTCHQRRPRLRNRS
ncbi:hypothetical protein T4A_1210 [Trichinella pseudospiralis]|uniref:Uncharacterized protein n=1 Tax=Trichinella pseudospiralis TaxID=6337 RepID=A0A0V1DQS3_TRIPS|nr:hypothetical protein T4A_1210 [Trichinella pseudospiralis]